MNCRACHLVDEQSGVSGGGNRTYDDFARRSPIPAREDGLATTPRQSPPLVNASLARRKFAAHFAARASLTWRGPASSGTRRRSCRASRSARRIRRPWPRSSRP